MQDRFQDRDSSTSCTAVSAIQLIGSPYPQSTPVLKPTSSGKSQQLRCHCRRNSCCPHLKVSRNSNIVEFLEMMQYKIEELQLFLQSEAEIASGSDVHRVS